MARARSVGGAHAGLSWHPAAIGSLTPHLIRANAALLLGASSLALASCGGEDAPPSKVKVAAAFTPLQEIATQIGGARVDATNLTPLGGQPHDLVPSAPALAALKRAKVVLYLGGTFQPAIVAEVAKLGASTTKVDLASDGALPAPKRVPGVRGPVEGAGSDATGADPHVWLDPERFVAMAQQAQAALIGADPAHRAEYQARGGKYVAQLTEVAAAFAQQLGSCKQKVILTTHPAWGYLAERFGFTQAVVGGIAPGAAADPRSLQALARYAKQSGTTTLFTTGMLPSKQARAIKRATGLTVAPLNPIEGLTQEQRDAGAGYAALMRENLATLASSLDCTAVVRTTGATTPTTPTTPAQ